MKLVQETLTWSVHLPFPRMGKVPVPVLYRRRVPMRWEGGGGKTHLTMGIVFTKFQRMKKHLRDNSFPLPFSALFSPSHIRIWGFYSYGILTAGLINFTICDRIANPHVFFFLFFFFLFLFFKVLPHDLHLARGCI